MAPTPTATPATVFVCCCAGDGAWCRPFADELRTLGYDTWDGQTGVGAGAEGTSDRPADATQIHLREVFMVILSPAAWADPGVQDQIQLALALGRHVLPVMREKTAVGGFLSMRQWVDVIGEEPRAAAHRVSEQLLRELEEEARLRPPDASERARAAGYYHARVFDPGWGEAARGSRTAGWFVSFHARQWLLLQIWLAVGSFLVLPAFLAPFLVLLAANNGTPLAVGLAATAGLWLAWLVIGLPLRLNAAGRAMARMGRAQGIPVLGTLAERYAHRATSRAARFSGVGQPARARAVGAPPPTLAAALPASLVSPSSPVSSDLPPSVAQLRAAIRASRWRAHASHPRTLWTLVLGLLTLGLAGGAAVQCSATATGGVCPAAAPESVLAIVLAGVGIALMAAGVLGALVQAIRLRRKGWIVAFVLSLCTFLLAPIALAIIALIFALAGPTQRAGVGTPRYGGA
jgi:hypothetical protein